MKLFILSLSSVILASMAVIWRSPDPGIANRPGLQEGSRWLGGSLESDLRREIRASEPEESRRRPTVARALAWIRQRIITCTNPAMASNHPSPEHEATNGQLRRQSTSPGATDQEVGHRSDASEATIEELGHPSAPFEASGAETGHSSPAPEVTNEELAADEDAITVVHHEDGYDVYYGGTFRFTTSSSLYEAFSQYRPRKTRFERISTIMGYMPYKEHYQLQLKSGQATVPLDQALHLLATEKTSQHTESNALDTSSNPPVTSSNPLDTTHHAGDELERSSSKSKDRQHQLTGDYRIEEDQLDHGTATQNHDGSSASNPSPINHYTTTENHDGSSASNPSPINHDTTTENYDVSSASNPSHNLPDPDKTTENHDGSSTSNPSSELSDVLIADLDRCPICILDFVPAEEITKNHWLFTKVARLNKCKHYFHPHCIRPWVIDRKQDCPSCRQAPGA